MISHEDLSNIESARSAVLVALQALQFAAGDITVLDRNGFEDARALQTWAVLEAAAASLSYWHDAIVKEQDNATPPF